MLPQCGGPTGEGGHFQGSETEGAVHKVMRRVRMHPKSKLAKGRSKASRG